MSERTRVVRAPERRRETSQTPGMDREEAFRTERMWAGLARAAGHTTSGWHHHGSYGSAIFVLEGRLRLEHGAGEVLVASAGDTLYVAPGDIHRESNPGEETLVMLVVRGGEGEIVVNVPGPAAG